MAVTITVVCDRVATVETDDHGRIKCPKCQGVCVLNLKTRMFDCHRCGRGWEEVPDHIRTMQEAEDYLSAECDSNPDDGQVYTCHSIECPKHGRRNRDYLNGR